MSHYAYRLAPVHYADIDGMESWLEDMAAKGYVLGQEGIFSGVVAFEKTEAKNYKYRLIANTYKYGWTGGRFNRYAPVPDEKTQEFHREFGWEYVATRKDFNIYVAKDPNAPEMDTDPQIQATAIHAAAKRKLWDIWGFSFIILNNLLITLWCGFEFLTGASRVFNFGLLLQCPLWILFLIQYIYAYIRLKRTENVLLSGQPLAHKSDYRKKIPLYWASRCVQPLLIASIFFTIFHVDFTVSKFDDWVKLEEYSGEVPFATMQELLPEAQFREDPSWGSYIGVTSSFLSETYTLEQKLHITLPDGTQTSGSLEITYLDAAWDWVAQDRAEDEFRRGDRADYDPKVIEIEGVDFAFYYNYYSYDYVVLRKGNVFVAVNFHIYEGDPITPEQIGQIMAGSLS